MSIPSTNDVTAFTTSGSITTACTSCGRTNKFNTPNISKRKTGTLNGVTRTFWVVRCTCGHRYPQIVP